MALFFSLLYFASADSSAGMSPAFFICMAYFYSSSDNQLEIYFCEMFSQAKLDDFNFAFLYT